VVPAGMSNSTVQPLNAAEPELIVYWPWKPVPQSETFAKLAVAVAASAVPVDSATAAATAAAIAMARMVLGGRGLMTGVLPPGERGITVRLCDARTLQ